MIVPADAPNEFRASGSRGWQSPVPSFTFNDKRAVRTGGLEVGGI